jgi:transposase
MISRLPQSFSTSCLRFTTAVADDHARLASGWRAPPLPGGVRSPRDHDERFQVISIPLSRTLPVASWAHARRKLKEIFDASASPIAEEGLKRIAEIYRIETDIRGLGSDQRLAMRQQLSAPLVAAFGAWLKEKRSRISAKSRLGEKLSYIHNHWAGLQVFLTDGRVEIDSNPVENRIRPIALGRKNHLFCGHDEGGRSWARIASLIETCLCRARHKQVYADRRTMPNGSDASPPPAKLQGLGERRSSVHSA